MQEPGLIPGLFVFICNSLLFTAISLGIMLYRKIFAEINNYVGRLQLLSPARLLTPEEILFCAIQDGQEPTFSVYLQYPGIDLDQTLTVSGASMLHIAVEYDRYQMGTRLLFCGADPNIQDREDGRTPLLHALLKEKYRFASLLLSYGADPRLGTFDGITPLIVTTERHNTRYTKYLQTLLGNI